MDIGYVVKKVKFLYVRHGFRGPLAAFGRKSYYYGIRMPINFFRYVWMRNTRGRRYPTFLFQNKQYPYLYSQKNFAWTTERIVEVPLVLPFLDSSYRTHARILEVGDVVRQYSPYKEHDILDKYEYRKGLINLDVEDFKPDHQYDLIVSVSTMEHVGFNDPDPYDAEKIPRSFRLFHEKWLAPGGIAVITMPIGFNPEVDKRLRAHSFPFAKTYFMKRVSADNRWEEATEGEALSMKYNEPFNNANAVVIGLIEAKR